MTQENVYVLQQYVSICFILRYFNNSHTPLCKYYSDALTALYLNLERD